MNDTIYHFGIKGMKWGRRRFQNKDGSLTPAGKQRYKEESSDSDSSTAKPPTMTIKRPGSSSSKKKVSEMTDDELRSRINRLNMEKQYAQLTKELSGESASTPKQDKGKSFVRELSSRAVSNVLIPAGEEIGRQLVRSYLAKNGNKAFNLKGEFQLHPNNKKK